MKAIAINTVFIILTVVIFLFFAVIIIFGFLNIAELQASQAICSTKLLNYCLSWAAKGFTEDSKPYKWNEKTPLECGKYLNDISDSSGPTKDQCKPIVK